MTTESDDWLSTPKFVAIIASIIGVSLLGLVVLAFLKRGAFAATKGTTGVSAMEPAPREDVRVADFQSNSDLFLDENSDLYMDSQIEPYDDYVDL